MIRQLSALLCLLLITISANAAPLRPEHTIDNEPENSEAVDDMTTYSFVDIAGPVSTSTERTIERAFAGNITDLKLTIVAGVADDIGYVGKIPVTFETSECDGVTEISYPQDVSSEVTLDGNIARFQLRAIENCCCVTGWGHLTGAGRADATFHWEVKIDPSLELLDPNPDLITNSGKPISDPNQLRLGGKPVKGAATDGVTLVLLRSKVAGPGTVQFSIPDWKGESSGGISADGSAASASATVNPINLGDNFYAFAFYRTPDAFNDGSSAFLTERSIKIRSQFTPQQGKPAQKDLTLRLVRPPLVFIHGLWSKPSTWQLALAHSPQFASSFVNYRLTNASSFSVNRKVFSLYAKDALSRLRGSQIAATQVDVIAHSMGGNLARLSVSQPDYRRLENYMQGDIHELITLNTPHFGTPVASEIKDWPNTHPIISHSLALIGFPIDQGAIVDLVPCSGAIIGIGASPVPSHALAGTYVTGFLEWLDERIENINRVDDLFQGDLSDGLVPLKSQLGGLPPSATDIFTGPGSSHLEATSSSIYSIRLFDLLNRSPKDALFAQFPPPKCPAPRRNTTQLPPTKREVNGGIIISVPEEYLVTAPGAQIPLTITTKGFDPENITIVGPGVLQTLLGPPFIGDFTVPVEMVGSMSIAAVGVDKGGVDSVSNSINLQVEAQAHLISVDSTESHATLFGIGTTKQLEFLGMYDDGITRNVTNSSTGTFFDTFDPSVATISPDGLITANSLGTTTISAQNGGITALVEVEVVPGLVRPRS